MLAVFPLVEPGVTVSDEPLKEKAAGEVTVSASVVAALNVPDAPRMVTITGPPMAALLAAVSVSTCVPGFVPAAKLAVTPLGSPVAESVTALPKPP